MDCGNKIYGQFCNKNLNSFVIDGNIDLSLCKNKLKLDFNLSVKVHQFLVNKSNSS